MCAANILRNQDASLEGLTIYGSVGRRAAAAIDQMLQNNQTISYVEINSEELGEEGMCAIFHGLATNVSVTMMRLFCESTFCGLEAYEALARVISQNTTLNSIYMTHSGAIGRSMASAVGNAVAHSTTWELVKKYT